MGLIQSNIKQGFKVVEVRYPKTYYSALNYLGSQIEYIPNEWTYPAESYGPLAVFITKRDANKFLSEIMPCYQHLLKEFTVFHCEYEPSKDQFLSIIERALARNILARNVYNIKILSKDACPRGTVFAERVKITEEVKIHE